MYHITNMEFIFHFLTTHPGAAGSYGLILEVSDNEEEEGEEREAGEEEDNNMAASDIDDIAIPRAVREAAREVLELDMDPRSLRHVTSSAAASAAQAPAVSSHSRKQGILFLFVYF